jgi:hypothetical protein
MVLVMRLSASLGSSALLLGLFALGCAGASELSAEGEAEPPVAAQAEAEPAAATPVAEPNAAPPSGPMPFDARWTDEVRSVVSLYESWGRVDDEMRFAPYLCRMPMAAQARVSESAHEATHGEKLYTLYAMDPVAYGAQPSMSMLGEGAAAPIAGVTQVIVKESFAPVPLDDDREARLGSGVDGAVGEHRLRPAQKDGKRFVAGERKGLYVMMKTDTAAEGTDAGWIYATVKPDMITVTAVGVIDSCAGCHAEAGDGRLFGLPGLVAPPPPPHSGQKVGPNANAAPL